MSSFLHVFRLSRNAWILVSPVKLLSLIMLFWQCWSFAHENTIPLPSITWYLFNLVSLGWFFKYSSFRLESLLPILYKSVFFTVLSSRHSLSPMILSYVYRWLLNLHYGSVLLPEPQTDISNCLPDTPLLNIPQVSPNENPHIWTHHFSPTKLILLCQGHPVTQFDESFLFFTTNKSPSLLTSTSSQVFLEPTRSHPPPL